MKASHTLELTIYNKQPTGMWHMFSMAYPPSVTEQAANAKSRFSPQASIQPGHRDIRDIINPSCQEKKSPPK